MRARETEIDARGAVLVFVGTGTEAMAAAFARERAHGRPVLVDPERRLFVATGMQRAWWRIVHPRLLVNAVRALWRGHRQGRVQGDAWQLGGAIVLDRDGRVLHRQRDGAGGDPLDLDALVAALPTSSAAAREPV